MSRTYPGIDANFSLHKPEDALGTMTITMPIKQWREIAAKLSTDRYDEWPIRAAIMDLVRQANQTFFQSKE